MPAVRVTITGHVQNVGFRMFVRNLAHSLGVKGEVWNGIDRSVQAHLEHPDTAILNHLVSSLRDGPGRVDDVRSEPAAEVGATTFEIGVTR